MVLKQLEFHPITVCTAQIITLIISGVYSGTYNGLTSADINGTYNTISNITLDSYDIESRQVLQMLTNTGDIGGTASLTQNRAYDLLNLSIQTMTLLKQISYALSLQVVNQFTEQKQNLLEQHQYQIRFL